MHIGGGFHNIEQNSCRSTPELLHEVRVAGLLLFWVLGQCEHGFYCNFLSLIYFVVVAVAAFMILFSA